jgi:hypothetical protein
MARKPLTREQIDAATGWKRPFVILFGAAASVLALIGLLTILPDGWLQAYVDFSDSIKDFFDA